jgi:hypothetical protein
MSPLLAPVFAQLITLQLGDRSEARWTKYDTTRWEATTVPQLALNITERRTDFRLSYSPSILLSPLDSTPRVFYVFHNVSTSVGYRLRHTTFSLGTSLSLGTLNFRLLGPQQTVNADPNATPNANPTTGMPPATGTPATGMPPTTTGTPTMPGTTAGNPTAAGALQQQVKDRKVRYYSSTTTLGVTHQVSKTVPIHAAVGGNASGGLGEENRADYPALRGWFVSGSTGYDYLFSKRDTFSSLLGLTKTWSSTKNEVAVLNAAESWSHQFAKRTAGILKAGLNITRFSQANGLRGFSVFPAFQLALSHETRVGLGMLSFSANTYSNPVLDPLRALVDPRVGGGGGIGYTRKRLSLGTSGATTISVAPAVANAGAGNVSQAEAHAGYQLGELVLVSTGVRVAHQTYQGTTVFPTTWGAFLGVTFGYDLVLAGRR